MKKLALLAAVGLVAASFGTAAMAADDAFMKADANNDSKVTLEEAMAVYPTLTQDLFNKADANGDGSLDSAEFTALIGLTAAVPNNSTSSSSAAQ